MNSKKVLSLIVQTLVVVIGTMAFSCSENQTTQSKISSMLQLQVNLRKEQMANPTQNRLTQMQAQGMDVTNMGIQKIYIFVNQQLTPEQVSHLQTMNITLYVDSWIPPVGNHPTGFYLAEMSVDKLASLAAEDFVVRLDTAETESEPQRILPQDNMQ